MELSSLLARIRASAQWRTRLVRDWVCAASVGLLQGNQQTWRQNLPEEIAFWEDFVRSQGGKYAADFAFRMRPDAPLQDELAQYLPNEHAKILDVGAGPLTYIAKIWKGHQLDITAVDPLAEEYKKIFDKYGLKPPIVTKSAEAESLSREFPPSSFDFAHARNCLDHCFHPVRATEEMVKVIKPGCVVYLHHFVDEGKNEAYKGLHRWNFHARNGNFIVSSPGRFPVNVTQRLKGRAKVETRTQDNWVIAVIRKV
jgi:SAM-dependent methyltransferase